MAVERNNPPREMFSQRDRDRREYAEVINQAWQLREELGDQGLRQALNNFRITDPELRNRRYTLMKREFGIRDTEIKQQILRTKQEDELPDDITTEELMNDAARHEQENRVGIIDPDEEEE